MGFGRATTVDVTGALIGRDALVVSEFGSTTAIGAAASPSAERPVLGGDFMSVALGSGASAHTMVTFVNYLPNLVEGLQVNPAAINGIANEPFLSSDGSFGFSASLKTAISAHSNALGVYKIAADGTIFDVHVVFASTLAVASGTTAGLGTPGNGERIGFFLIQDGFDRYGSLPDNLSFIAPQGGTPANANGGTAPVLMSATLGVLSVASVSIPSPDSIPATPPGPVRRGAGGRELMIGFEDLPTARPTRFPGRRDRRAHRPRRHLLVDLDRLLWCRSIMIQRLPPPSGRSGRR